MKEKIFAPFLTGTILLGGLASCSDKSSDDNEFNSNATLGMQTLVVPEAGPAASYNVDYRLDFSLSDVIMSAAPEFGSTKFVFRTNPARIIRAGNTLTAKAPSCAVVQGVAGVTDIMIQYRPQPVVPPVSVNGHGLEYYNVPWLLTRYEVAPGMKAYTYPQRAAFKGHFKSSYNDRQGQTVVYESTDCIMEYVLDVINRKADVYIYNAKFAAPMPVQKVLWLKDLMLQFDDDGIELGGINIVPQSREGDGFTPYADFTFDRIEFDVTTPTMTECDVEFTVAGRFSGEFEGKSVM